MLHQELRSHAAEELKNLLTLPHAQAHLRRYGWRPGMPVIIAAPYETLDTVMGLVSTYDYAVLIGSYDPYFDELTLWQVFGPDADDPIGQEDQCLDLKRNEAFTFREMYRRAMHSTSVRFWPKGWDRPVRVREIPLFARSERLACSEEKLSSLPARVSSPGFC
ncbi:hypothetical protein [Glutamicibacter protophormiae]|uniref:hypothetical protein n=1 Tax=Glutamicibacter protophormiae TaxID=37930 RepID=UPI00332CB827